MVRQPVRFALLLGALTAVAVAPARADDKGCTTGTHVRTIKVTECVPETYKVKRTVYKTECKTEEYDTFKCEWVPEVRENVVTVCKKVPEYSMQTRKVCKNVTEWEERTVMKKCYKNVQETVMKKKLKCLGHWECETVCKTNHLAKLHNCFKKCCNDPCDPCASNNCAREPETRQVQRKKWVYCPEYECCPVTVCKKVCVEVPTTCKVPVCKQVWSEEQVKVCTYKTVEEKQVQKCTVNVLKKTPVKATRTVRVCVPTEEWVTCTRMVSRCVERQVACAPACTTSCTTTCNTNCAPACNDSCGRPRFSLFNHGCRDNGCRNDHGCCR